MYNVSVYCIIYMSYLYVVVYFGNSAKDHIARGNVLEANWSRNPRWDCRAGPGVRTNLWTNTHARSIAQRRTYDCDSASERRRDGWIWRHQQPERIK